MNVHAEQVERLLAGPRPVPIVTAGLPVLRQPADRFDGQLDDTLLASLIEAMRDTMLAAPGVGLAATQLGLALRIAVIEDSAVLPTEVAAARDRRPLPFQVLINPVYRAIGSATAAWYEGCLSVPGYQAVVERPATVELTGQDEHGQAFTRRYHGWPARIVQHETDHLAGMLYLDRAVTRSLAENSVYQALWSGPSIEAARRTLGF